MSNHVLDHQNMQTLDEAIEFPVIVEGKDMTAKVVACGDNGYDDIFRIEFGDGFSDFFHCNEDGIEGETANSGPYARAIREDLNMMGPLGTNYFRQNFRHAIDGKEVNVWVRDWNTEQGNESYIVAYNGRYMFVMTKEGNEWKANLRNENDILNSELAKRVGFLLDSVL